MIQPRPHIAALSVYGLASLDIPPGKRLVSLAQNESPFPPSPLALEAARNAAAEGALYPDPSCRGLREAIGEVQGLDAERIICSSSIEFACRISRLRRIWGARDCCWDSD